MVAQNTIRTYEEKQVLFEEIIIIDYTVLDVWYLKSKIVLTVLMVLHVQEVLTIITVFPRSSLLILNINLLYKMGHYFLDL